MKKIILMVLSIATIGVQVYAKPAPKLTIDKKAIKYVSKKPAKGSPQDLVIRLILAQQDENGKEVDKIISSTVPGWLRKAFKKNSHPGNPIILKTLRYRLICEDNKWRVSFSFNRKDKSYTSGNRYPVWENDQWKIK